MSIRTSTTGARKKLIAAQQQRSNELKFDAVIDQEDESDVDNDVDMEKKVTKPIVTKNPSSSQVGASNPFLRLFWDLGNEDSDVRTQARDTLIETLKKEQNDLLLTDANPRDKLTENTRYAVKRLFRGLSASSPSARTGFADALSCLIDTFYPNVISLAYIQSVRLSESAMPTQASRQEQTHHKFGVISYFRIVINTKLIQDLDFRGAILPLIETALDIGMSNRHVTEQAFESIIAACKYVTFEQFKESVEPKILAAFVPADAVKMEDESSSDSVTTKVDLNSFNAEQLILLLGMHSFYEANKQNASEAGKSVLDHQARHPFAPESFPSLLSALNSSTKPLAKSSALDSEFDDAPQQHSSITRVLSSAWKQALSTLITRDLWQQFWALCDTSLFGQKSTEARKITGFLIFHHLLSSFSQPDQVSFLFQPQFMRAFMTHLSGSHHKLHSQAQTAQKAIISKAELNPHLVSSILASLLDSERGSPRFDSITKSKTIQSLIAFLDDDSIIQYQKQLLSTFHNSTKTDTAPSADGAAPGDRSNGIRMWVVDQMYALCKNSINLIDSPTAAHSDVLTTAFAFFTFYAHFDSQSATITDLTKSKKKGAKPQKSTSKTSGSESFSDELLTSVCKPVSVAVSARQACHSRLWTLLNDLLPRPQTKAKNTTESESGEGHDEADISVSKSWAHRVLELFNMLTSRGYILLTLPAAHGTAEEAASDSELVDEAREARETVLQIANIMQQKQQSSTDGMEASAIMHAKQDRVISLLMIHLALLSITEPSITDMLQEVQLGYASFKEIRDSGKSAKKAKKADTEDEPVWIELFVDILLTLLVRPSALIRDLCKLAFVPFCQYMNPQALDDMLLIIARKATDEMNKKKHGDDEDEESDDEFEPFDIEGQDEKAVNKRPKNAVHAENSDDDDDMSDDEPLPVTLKGKPAKQPTKQADSDSDSEDDEEDEMLDLESLEGLLNTPLTEEEQAQVDAMREQAPVSGEDAHLSNIVRLRQQANKKQKKDLVEQTIHFQLRVLDLIDVYARLQSSSSLIVSPLLVRLIEVAHRTRTNESVRAFHTKLGALVKKICKSKRKHPAVEFDSSKSTDASTSISIESLQSVMTQLMESAPKTDVADTLSLLSHAMLFLTRMSLPATFLVANDRTGAEWKDARRLEHRNFVIQLYRTGIITFFTVKRRFNTKFFQDFITAAPAMAFELMQDIANIAYTPLSVSELSSEPAVVSVPASAVKGKKSKAKAVAAAPVQQYSGPFALNGFLRSEAFSLIGHMFTHRAIIERMDKDKIRSTIEAVSRATTSAIDYILLDDSIKNELRSIHTARDSTKEAPKEIVDVVDPKTLSKQELKAYKEKQKKKRRREREKEAQKALKANQTTKSTEQSPQALIQTEAMRLKSIIKSVNTTTTHVKRLSDSSMLSLFGGVQESLSQLPATHANTLKSVVHNLCSSLQWSVPSVIADVQSADVKQKKARRDTKIRAKTDQAKQDKQDKQERSLGQKRARDAIIPLKVNKKAKKEGSLDADVEAQSSKKIAATDKKPRKQGNQVKGQNMKDKVKEQSDDSAAVESTKTKRPAESQPADKRKQKRSKQ